MLACIRYVYIRAWRERREDSIPPGSYTRKKNGRHGERERERKRNREAASGTKCVEEEGRENDATPLEGCGRGYEGATEEEGHWDARNESLLVPRRNGALGRPNRRGTKARRVPARERGVRIGQWKEREREREATAG